MILAAGLTPTWQRILRFDALRAGEVNRAAEVHDGASGKGINVALALSSSGKKPVALAPLGGVFGQRIAAEFKQRGLQGVWTACAAPTRLCTTLLDTATGTTTELVENAGPLSEAELAAFTDAYQQTVRKAAFVVLTGSLPHGTPTTFYRDLLRQTSCRALLDSRGPELLAALEARPFVVKPNRAELSQTVGRPLTSPDDVRAAMRELIERGAQAVVVTDGPGAVWVMEGDEAWEVTPPTVQPVVNPIGCGDCLAAGVALGLCKMPLMEGVRLGVAAAADNVTQLLPARLHPGRIAGWMKQVEIRPW